MAKSSARRGAAATAGAAGGAAGGAAPAAARPGLLDRLTWLVLVAFLVLLALGHG